MSEIAEKMGGKKWIADTVTNLKRGLKIIQFHADAANGVVSWGLR